MDYLKLVKTLKTYDTKQLLELFHDINDIDWVENLHATTGYYISNYEPIGQQSEYSEWKETDDARRLREIRSEN